MRNLAFAVVAVAMVTGGFVGCGGSTTRQQTGAAGVGAAGTTGVAGSTGAAGTDQAGTNGAAGATGGTTGVAGDTSLAGTTGTPDAAAGESGAAGAAGAGLAGSGAAGQPAPYCDATNTKPLPYNVEADFKPTDVINAIATWNTIANPNCDQTVFPPLTPPADGGTDGSADGGTDSATEAGASDAGVDGGDGGDGSTATLELTDPDAGDAGDASADGGASDGHSDAVADAAADAPADVPVDVAAGDTVATTDAAPLPACYEFTYDPDACIAANGGVAANAVAPCYSGAIFVPTTANMAGAGICIASGATKVTFMARASRDGARIKFGSTRPGPGSTEEFIPITTTWAQYSVPQPDDYLNTTNDEGSPGGVWNGFSVVTEPEDHVGGTYIFVKDIQWVAQ